MGWSGVHSESDVRGVCNRESGIRSVGRAEWRHRVYNGQICVCRVCKGQSHIRSVHDRRVVSTRYRKESALPKWCFPPALPRRNVQRESLQYCERVDQHWPFQHCLPGSLCHGTRPYNAAFRESLQKQNEWTLLIICQILAIILKAFEIVVKCCVSPLKRMESTQGQGATLLPSCRVRSSATPKSHLRTRSRLTW